MKKFLMFFVTLGIAWLSGCANSEKVIEGEVQNVMTTKSISSEESVAVPESHTTDDQMTTVNDDGYIFIFHDTQVKVDADAKEIIEQLGEPLSYFEAPSCAFQGLDKIYTYNGFEIDTYPVENKDYVSAIVFKDDSVVTAEGVGIGDSMEKLQQAYGSEGTKENGVIVYAKNKMKLCFILQEDEIISVEYRTTVLD